MAGKTMAAIGQELDDHKEECLRLQRSVDGRLKGVNERLGRIERLMIGVALSTILTLLSVIGGMALELYHAKVAQLDRLTPAPASVTVPPGYAVVRIPTPATP